jgi:hypothetical protein
VAAIALQRARAKDTEGRVLDLLVRHCGANNKKSEIDKSRCEKGRMFSLRPFLTPTQGKRPTSPGASKPGLFLRSCQADGQFDHLGCG